MQALHFIPHTQILSINNIRIFHLIRVSWVLPNFSSRYIYITSSGFDWCCLFLRYCYGWTGHWYCLVTWLVIGLVTGINSGPAAGVLLTRSAADPSIEVLIFAELVTVFKSCLLPLYIPPSCVCILYDRRATCLCTVPDFCHLLTLLSHIYISWPYCNGVRLCTVLS